MSRDTPGATRKIQITQAAGKTVLITGANAGIGKDVARQLAQRDGLELLKPRPGAK